MKKDKMTHPPKFIVRKYQVIHIGKQEHILIHSNVESRNHAGTR